jgi:hypothetical protein
MCVKDAEEFRFWPCISRTSLHTSAAHLVQVMCRGYRRGVGFQPFIGHFCKCSYVRTIEISKKNTKQLNSFCCSGFEC